MAGGMSGAEGNGAITRGRVTRANLDVAETFALQDTGVAEVRRHGAVSQVAARSKGANSFYCNNVRLYASGAWGLQPLQLRLAQLQEKTAGAGSIYLTAASGGSGANLLQGAALTPFPKFRRPTGTGMGAVASGTNADGSDIFFRSAIVAGASWDQSASVSTEAHITALTSTLSAIEPSTQPLDILARSNAAQAVDTGFCIRFTLPGTKQHFPDWIAAFAFGQYALLIGGDGELRLWHYAPYLSAPGGASEWRSVLSARYCSPSQVSGNSHCLCIFPHMGESGEKNISILSLNMDASSVSAAGGASTLSPAQGNTGAHTTTEALFTFDGLSTNQVDQGATGQVTTSQRIYLLERRDIRGEWQLSRLSYPVGTSNPAGKLIGQAHAPTTPLALGGVAAEAWTLTKLSREGGAMTITPRLKDSLTQSTTLIDYPYPLFDFYSDGTKTPLLYGYTLVKAATVQTITPGEFATNVKNVQVQLGGQDARNEVAKITIEDPADSWPRLRNRGRLSLRLTTTYTPPGDTQKTITLFRGAVSRPTRTKKGTVNARQGLNGSVRAYPSPEWSEYQCNAAGMWERLSATTLRTALSYELFLSDPAAALGADGSLTAWKVTDVIKRLLSAAGFPSGMQRIPDLAIRLRAGIGTSISDSVLEPGTSIAQQVQNLAQKYLGRFLAFDPNDGTEGKWILLAAPPAGSVTPVYNFVGDIPAPSSGTIALPHALHAYPANTAPTFGRATSYVVPPEKNHLWAFCAINAGQAGPALIDNHLHNFLSYKVPGSSTNPDPQSPHYIGHEELFLLGDPSFWAGGRPLSWQETQAMVDYVLLRLFVGVCMPRRVQPIRAPLVFIQDVVHGFFRPLRFYDPVTLDGQAGWYVRSINIDYSNDRSQLATYELERLVAYRPGV